MDVVARINAFWFGEQQNGFPVEDKSALWWSGSAETDQYIRQEFGTALEDALAGKLDHWQEQPESAVALILLLDQFCRNVYRGSDKAFAGDAKALQVCLAGLEHGTDKHLGFAARQFFYMPLEHAESLPMQDRAIACFSQLHEEVPESRKEWAANALLFAEQHRDVIRQFGRFPHRNSVLGRESTSEERTFLEDAPRWGQ